MDEQFVHEDQMRNARTQGVGSMVSEQNRQNALELMRKMHKIDTQNAAAKARIENNLDKALQCVDNVIDFKNRNRSYYLSHAVFRKSQNKAWRDCRECGCLVS